MHCGIFVTAASRRSPGSVSVPMRRVVLSHPLAVLGLVSRYLTNNLIARSPLPGQQAFAHDTMRCVGSSGINSPFGELSPTLGHVRNALLARSPLYRRAEARFRVRLACFSHAASVQSEPGSNSSIDLSLLCLPDESSRHNCFNKKES